MALPQTRADCNHLWAYPVEFMRHPSNGLAQILIGRFDGFFGAGDRQRGRICLSRAKEFNGLGKSLLFGLEGQMLCIFMRIAWWGLIDMLIRHSED
jgi:hypothetical protein